MSGIISFIIRTVLVFGAGRFLYIFGYKYNQILRAASDPKAKVYPGKLRIDKQANLSGDERQVEAGFAAKIETKLTYYIIQYRKKWDSVLNTDNARELSDDYNKTNEARAKYARAVHEPAGALIKAMWQRMLKEPDPKDDNLVLFLAGGGGSGKTTTVEDIPALKDMSNHAQIIYDTTMASFDSSKTKVEEALASGKNVTILYIHRPCSLATIGVIERAIRSGRTVPADTLADDHFNAQRTFIRLYRTFFSSPSVDFGAIDNSGPRREASFISIDFLESALYNDVVELRLEVRRIIEDEYERRKGTSEEIPEYVYRSILGEDV
jgi:hypothetical protein